HAGAASTRCRHIAEMIMRHRSRDAFFHPTHCGKPPHSVKTLNFPQKVARQFDGNVVFFRYLATIFAAFVRCRHNAAFISDEIAPKRRVSSLEHMSPIARVALDRVRTKAAST